MLVLRRLHILGQDLVPFDLAYYAQAVYAPLPGLPELRHLVYLRGLVFAFRHLFITSIVFYPDSGI